MSKKVLMVCLGNICRSPTAEAILRHKAQELKLDFHVDSAGTAGWHAGERSDIRSIKHAENRGYQMTHLARQLTVKDFTDFDHILVMDDSNYKNSKEICPPELLYKLETIASYDENKNIKFIPDPYYMGPKEFDQVIDYLEICIEGFLNAHANIRK